MNRNKVATLSLLLARVLYTINWFNIASIFYFIASDFREDIAMLGIISASFLIGVGLFQVPAGIIAAKYGPRNIAIYGIVTASSASLISKYLEKDAEGLGIGLLNSAHALGGILGLFGWVILAEIMG